MEGLLIGAACFASVAGLVTLLATRRPSLRRKTRTWRSQPCRSGASMSCLRA